MNANLGSGGTHIDTAITSMNGVITSVGNGSTSTNTLPYVFLSPTARRTPQTKGVPNGGWAGSNHATTIRPRICNYDEEPRHQDFRAVYSLRDHQSGQRVVCRR